MTEQQRQHVSALVDGELEAVLVHPTIAAIEGSPELAGIWERYHLMGQALRGEALSREHGRIAARVRERLATEPTPISPRRRERTGRAGPFAGAALAAAAAFLAVFAVPQLFGPQTPVGTPAPALAIGGPPPQFHLDQPLKRWQLEQPALKDKLDRFLVNHHAHAPAAGIKGYMPYATVVGYDSGR